MKKMLPGKAVLLVFLSALFLLVGCKKPRGPFALQVPKSFSQNAPVGQLYSHTFSQPDQITKVTVPSWSTFNKSTRTLSGTPGPNDFGTFPVYVEGETKEQIFTFTSTITVPSPKIEPVKEIRIPVTQNRSYSIPVHIKPANTYKISVKVTEQPTTLQKIFTPKQEYQTNSSGKVILRPLETSNDVPGEGKITISVVSNNPETGIISMDVPVVIFK